MVLPRSFAILLALVLPPAHAQNPAPSSPEAARATAVPSLPAPAEAREAQRAEHLRALAEARVEQQGRNAAGEIRTLRDPLWDGYRLEFEHNLVFEHVASQAELDLREYELALRLVEPRMALAALMERLLDAGFTVEEPIGPPQARVLRFWREGRSLGDARFVVHLGERPLSPAPSPVEQGATGVLILRLYERRRD